MHARDQEGREGSTKREVRTALPWKEVQEIPNVTLKTSVFMGAG